MKVKLMLLGIILLLQSCFTYKQLEPNKGNLVVGDSYKVNHLEYGKLKKGKVSSVNDSILTYKISNGRLDELKIDDIQEIKKRKFALGKTIALVVTVKAGAVGALLLAFNGYDWGIGSNNLDY